MRVCVLSRTLKMTGVGWYSQYISLNSLNLVKFYICKSKSTGRGSLIKKQTRYSKSCTYSSCWIWINFWQQPWNTQRPAVTKIKRKTDCTATNGFTVISKKSKCIMCQEGLSTESMKPSKLLRHLSTKYPDQKDKSVEFFERKLKCFYFDN
jgi:hypothetical protein